jgi:precorrin-2/cobalt-factor-2 C20-methyltransferase
MTLRGLRTLNSADAVFLPATRGGMSYARSIVEEYLDEDRQEIVELVCPAYRDRAAIKSRWVELAQIVHERLGSGRTGVFICEGDPSLYSTWIHLRAGLKQIRSSLELRTIPGVTSVSAAAAMADFPLAGGNDCVLITPAAIDGAVLARSLEHAETLALLKQGGQLTMLADALQSVAPSARVALVRRAGRPNELILHGSDAIRTAAADYFTTVLISRSEE